MDWSSILVCGALCVFRANLRSEALNSSLIEMRYWEETLEFYEDECYIGGFVE